ncbi:hypothetical protein [Microbispora rosea]|uniref:hypothetical protein n=1 Tax=Microbispora rosea TaxID=58117 RepID=UPI00341F16A9
MNELSQKRIVAVKRALPPVWYGTRRGRRTTTLVGVAALALLWANPVTCWFLAPGATARWLTLGATAVALVIYSGVFAVLIAATDGVVGLTEEDLDERQLAERRRSYALAHRLTAYMLGGAALLVGIVASAHDILEGPSVAAFTFLIAAWASHKVIPHLVACWCLSDAPPSDDE